MFIREADIHLSKMNVEGSMLMPDGFKKLENPPVEITGLNDGVYALTLDSQVLGPVKTTFSIAPGKCTRLRIRLIRHDQTPEASYIYRQGLF